MSTRKTKQNTISSLDIAKYFIWKSNKENKPISNKKLQKLLYYSQAWNLVFNNEPLFKEQIEAWIHGPVVKKVYNKYKRYGFNPIKEVINWSSLNSLPKKQLLDEIWRVYGKYDADYLEQLTHNEDPWQNARALLKAGQNSSNVIMLEDMKTYYSSKIDG